MSAWIGFLHIRPKFNMKNNKKRFHTQNFSFNPSTRLMKIGIRSGAISMRFKLVQAPPKLTFSEYGILQTIRQNATPIALLYPCIGPALVDIHPELIMKWDPPSSPFPERRHSFPKWYSYYVFQMNFFTIRNQFRYLLSPGKDGIGKHHRSNHRS